MPQTHAETGPAVFAASDIHGHFEQFQHALREKGLVGPEGSWTGGDAQLWVLGDLFDRGGQGLETLRLLRRLQGESAAAGGTVEVLLGNHELLLLGSKRFGGQGFRDYDGNERQFLQWWVINGGFERDAEELEDEEAEWLLGRPAMAFAADCLLVHSDAVSYLDWGRSIDEVNAEVRSELAATEPERWWQLFRELTRRHEFEGEEGAARARRMLETYGGRMIVHGHSTIPDTTGAEPSEISEPRRYADGLVMNIDGGIYEGGPSLVVELTAEGA
ncbi:metallophosphoesterase [Salininema proteolyticum]|uniref:Metallophosphoesterase n=1 Tax=Salininema proteolyticum TaxID=1607685 RepID=A0ABV8U2G0_9ACTN